MAFLSRSCGALALALAVSCTSLACSGADEAEADVSSVTESSARAALRIAPLDIWGQALPNEGAAKRTLTVTQQGKAVPLKEDADGAYVLLAEKATLDIHLEAPDHEPLDVTVDFTGGDALAAAKARTTSTRGGVSFAHQSSKVGARTLPTHALYLGLRHKWFSASGRPARRGNSFELLMDGEESWRAVHRDIKEAKTSIEASTWWWESDFEMVRSAQSTLEERRRNTVIETFAASRATKRILVGQLWGQDGILRWVNTDKELRAYGAAPGDNFEFMGQANRTMGRFEFSVAPVRFSERAAAAFPDAQGFDPEEAIPSDVPSRSIDLAQIPIPGDQEMASYHQKFVVVDADKAYVGGMNFRAVDWDSSEHSVYDARRMPVDASDADRGDVTARGKLPAMGPRKDYMARIVGPSAQDVADVFQRRWEFLRSSNVEFSENATKFEVARDNAAKGTTQVQVTATLPQPFMEHAIAETWFNAVRNAEKFIYIEDQYFRMPMINEAIAKRMSEVPELKLVVITMPMSSLDPGCVQTNIAHEYFQKNVRDRYITFYLQSFEPSDARYVGMDVHSKMLIVDDKFMSIGSANKNNRGMIYEGEMNVAVADENVVRPLRKKIFANLMPSTPETDDVAVWWTQLQGAARFNDAALAASKTSTPPKPKGFLYTLVPEAPAVCKFQSVGPDQT